MFFQRKEIIYRLDVGNLLWGSLQGPCSHLDPPLLQFHLYVFRFCTAHGFWLRSSQWEVREIANIVAMDRGKGASIWAHGMFPSLVLLLLRNVLAHVDRYLCWVCMSIPSAGSVSFHRKMFLGDRLWSVLFHVELMSNLFWCSSLKWQSSAAQKKDLKYALFCCRLN